MSASMFACDAEIILKILSKGSFDVIGIYVPPDKSTLKKET